MTNTHKIKDFAMKCGGTFTRRDLLKSFPDKASAASLSVQLNRMVADNRIERTERGMYRLPKKWPQDFDYTPNEHIINLVELVRQEFTYADFSIWQPSALVPLMHNVPVVDFTFVDVERCAMESVFFFLQEKFPNIFVLLSPSKEECYRYSTPHESQIFVRLLVKESPLVESCGCMMPTIEKMLVDAVGDNELDYMQGSEIYDIFESALFEYNINKRRLMRYASRRNRKQKVEKIIEYVYNDILEIKVISMGENGGR